MPAHCRMRAIDRDLIRGGHYGQRSCEPHKQAEHMAAPTKTANVKKVLANPEPSRARLYGPAVRCKLDLAIWRQLVWLICIRPFEGSVLLPAIMDIRAHPISFASRPCKADSATRSRM